MPMKIIRWVILKLFFSVNTRNSLFWWAIKIFSHELFYWNFPIFLLVKKITALFLILSRSKRKSWEALKRIIKTWHRENKIVKPKNNIKTIENPSPHSNSSSKSVSSVRAFRHEHFPYSGTTSEEEEYME